MTTDGRDLYFSVEVSPNDRFHIWAVDLRDPAHPVRPIVAMPGTGTPRRGPALAMGRDGALLAMDDPRLYSIDVTTRRLSILDNVQGLFSVPPGSALWQVLLAYNPWTDQRAVASKRPAPFMTMFMKTGPAGSWLPVFGGPTPGCAIATTAPQPFELVGIGCPNGLGKEPRLGWLGLPVQGQTFHLTLRDAEPNGLAVFWVGTSDTFAPGIGALPWDAASLGAPGCRMYASSDFSLFSFVDAAGRASVSLPVPVNSALHGIDAYSQSVSSSGGNQLGFASSGAVLIRLR